VDPNCPVFVGCLILRSKYSYGGERVGEIVRYTSPLNDAESVFAMKNAYS
jgi:hypothetical protein